MKNSKIKPLREPLSRIWFLSRGYKQADPRYTKGEIIWLHPKTNDVLTKYGTKLKLKVVPKEKYRAVTTRYLAISPAHSCNVLIARLKYHTFIGDIPAGYVIDHIDGDTFNNDIRNLRAIPPAINSRDGGFMRKLRNKGIIVAMFPGIILEGYERMAKWKASHTKRQYNHLEKDDLLRIFVGPTFSVVDTSDLDSLDINRHFDPMVERD